MADGSSDEKALAGLAKEQRHCQETSLGDIPHFLSFSAKEEFELRAFLRVSKRLAGTGTRQKVPDSVRLRVEAEWTDAEKHCEIIGNFSHRIFSFSFCPKTLLRRTPLRSSAKPVFQPLVAHYPNIVQLIALFDKKIPQFSIWVANRLTELMGWGTVTAAAFLCGRLNARFVGMIVAAVALASVATAPCRGVWTISEFAWFEPACLLVRTAGLWLKAYQPDQRA